MVKVIEAAKFYTNVFGLETIRTQKYGDVDFPAPPEAADYLHHCHLRKGDFQIMLVVSVDKQPDHIKRGLSLIVQCESEE